MTEQMTPETVEKIREKLQCAQRSLGGHTCRVLDEALALFPAKPVPEAALGPYTCYERAYPELDDGTWCVESADSKRIAFGIPDKPTAKLLALAWKMRELLDGVRILLANTSHNYPATQRRIKGLLKSLEVQP